MHKNAYYILIGTIVAVIMIVFGIFAILGNLNFGIISTMIK